MNSVQFINRVRRRLNNPLAQAPTDRQILDRGIDELRNATMTANNTGNAWAVEEYTVTTEADTRRYEVTANDFGKALLVCTVPSTVPGVVEPEMPLQFTQLEQLPRDWAWLSDTGWWWSLWLCDVSQRSRYAAFFNFLDGSAGFKTVMEIRPTPQAGELYRVLYQVGDWSQSMNSTVAFQFPFPSLDFHFVTLISDSLLPVARWTHDENANIRQAVALERGYAKDLERSTPTWEDYISSLSVSDIVWSESFADYQGL